jgi:hypothetical protein
MCSQVLPFWRRARPLVKFGNASSGIEEVMTSVAGGHAGKDWFHRRLASAANGWFARRGRATNAPKERGREGPRR